MKSYPKKPNGFTLVELMIVMGIMLVLYGMTFVGITGIRQRASLNTSIDLLATDISQQQLKAMIGETEGRSTHDSYGIYLRTQDYILYHGSTYVSNDASNFPVSWGDAVRLSSSTFPGGKIHFDVLSGEITNFIAGQNTFTISSSASGESKTITLNRYGVLTNIQ